MGSRRLLFCASLLAVPALVFGCNGDELSSPTNGSLDIVTTTAGDAPDPDGYTVQVDDAQPRPIGPSGRLQSGAIAPGDHTVTLGGIASNCDVVGTNPRTVNVTAGVTNRQFPAHLFAPARHARDHHHEQWGVAGPQRL